MPRHTHNNQLSLALTFAGRQGQNVLQVALEAQHLGSDQGRRLVHFVRRHRGKHVDVFECVDLNVVCFVFIGV